MQTYRRAGTVIFVSNRSPETTVAQDIEAHGLVMQWARSIRAAVDLLNSAREKTVIVTELALADAVGQSATSSRWQRRLEHWEAGSSPWCAIQFANSSFPSLWEGTWPPPKWTADR